MQRSVPVQIEPYIEAIGLDLTMELLLRCGGTRLYIARRPGADSDVAQAIGPEAAGRLGEYMGGQRVQVPRQTPWLVNQLRRGWGWSVARVARAVGRSEASIYRMARDRDTNQLDLFAGGQAS